MFPFLSSSVVSACGGCEQTTLRAIDTNFASVANNSRKWFVWKRYSFNFWAVVAKAMQQFVINGHAKVLQQIKRQNLIRLIDIWCLVLLGKVNSPGNWRGGLALKKVFFCFCGMKPSDRWPKNWSCVSSELNHWYGWSKTSRDSSDKDFENTF